MSGHFSSRSNLSARSRAAHRSESHAHTLKPWLGAALVAVLAFGAGRWSVDANEAQSQNASASASGVQSACASSLTARSLPVERGWLQGGSPFAADPAVDPAVDPAATQAHSSAPSPTKDQTASELTQLLQTGQLADINQDQWAKQASQSAATLELLKTQFMQASSASHKQALLAILSGVNTAQRDSFAMQLTRARDPEDRAMAYQLLGSSSHGDPAAVQQAILAASQQESDSRALIAAINSLAQQGSDLDAAGKAPSIARISQLTQHPDPAVARQAIGNLAALSQDEQTILLLRAHLQAPTPELQLAALRGLGRINTIDSDTRAQLTQLSTDPSANPTVRKVSGHLLRDQSCNS
jgi:hypothetical protein